MMAKSRFYTYSYEDAKEQTYSTKRTSEDGNGETRNWRTVWTFPTTSTEKGNHTAAFPEELPYRCISVTSKPGDLVFDPFVGSGTTLVVAKRLGRKYFGCDLSEEYIQQAKERLAEEGKREAEGGKTSPKARKAKTGQAFGSQSPLFTDAKL